MGSCLKLFSLFIITLCHYGNGDQSYEVINFKIPQRIWRQALQPSPVLRSPVTVTVPVQIHDSNEAEDMVENEAPESNAGTIVQSADATQVLEDPAPVLTNPTVTIVTQKPQVQVPLQDEIITEAPPIPGQVIRLPCECRNGQCGCCTGTFMERFRMKACGNITFIPEDFVFDVRLNVNNNTVVRRRVSASDPPPICFNPRRAPFVEICAEISNIQIRNRNAHACLDINAEIAGFPVYSAPFRCLSFGASGIKTGQKPRPVSSPGPKPVSLFGNSNNDNDDGGSFIENTVGTVFGEGGLFGGGSSNDDGPFDGVGDAIGDFLDLDS